MNLGDYGNDHSSDFSVPEDLVHSSSVPAAVSVSAAEQQIRSASKPVGIPAVTGTTKVVASLTDVTNALQHVFDQNKAPGENAAIMGMLETISADVKLILSELVKLNDSRVRENDMEEGKVTKHARHH